MKIFLIEKSMDGLLSALFVSFTENIYPDDVLYNDTYQPRIDAISINIVTDKVKANRVKTALYKYGGDDIIAHLNLCLSSCSVNNVKTAFCYAHYTLKMRTDVSERLGEKCVSDFSFTVQKVLHERHIMTGFIRFKESSSGIMYAEYSPDNDISSILAPHFLRRLGAIPFIIHDVKRGKVAISNGKNIKIMQTSLSANFTPSDAEREMNVLWRKYYRQINIEERQHLKQQAGYFPHRYRKYCFETWE